MSRNPLDYAKAIADRVTGRSADVLSDTVLQYGDKGNSKGAASTPKPNYHQAIKSADRKSIDVFYGIDYEVSPTRKFINAIKFLYSSSTPGDAKDKSWIQFASRQIIFQNASREWTPDELTKINTAARDDVPVTHTPPILWNVDSKSPADPHYSFEVKYMPGDSEVPKDDSAEVQMVDHTDFQGFVAEEYARSYSKGETVNKITMIRTMKTYLLRSDVAVWGCSWTSTIACRYLDGGKGNFVWWPDSNEYTIKKGKGETGFVSALDEEHAKVLLAENSGSPIR